MSLRFPELLMLPLARYQSLLGAPQMRKVMARIDDLRARLHGRVVWNVSSTAVGGGVAEMVRSLLAYARGAGVDARWAVIDGPPEFFRFTKLLHNAIHGIGALDPEPELFEAVSARNAAELAPMVREHDVVIVHDPQPAGLIPALVARGAHVIWRCHIGLDSVNAQATEAWAFLARYLRDAHAYVFSRAAYVPVSGVAIDRTVVIPPTIDPFSAKNQALDDVSVLAILAQIGLVTADVPSSACTFMREDGTPDRVDRQAEVICDAPPPGPDVPLVVQVSRWDRLKDPGGVLEGFARLTTGAHLVLAGPSVRDVKDDPEGASVLADVIVQWRALPDPVRQRILLASLPTADVDENGAMVNALQRHATVIVQKSIQEGFGLTVTEAMWKSRPVIASAVGGIQDQVDDGVQGLLIRDPYDLDALARTIAHVLDDPDAGRRMGALGHARVVDRYLGLDSLLRYGGLIERLDDMARSLTLPAAIV
jgi:trehalose synthase